MYVRHQIQEEEYESLPKPLAVLSDSQSTYSFLVKRRKRTKQKEGRSLPPVIRNQKDSNTHTKAYQLQLHSLSRRCLRTDASPLFVNLSSFMETLCSAVRVALMEVRRLSVGSNSFFQLAVPAHSSCTSFRLPSFLSKEPYSARKDTLPNTSLKPPT